MIDLFADFSTREPTEALAQAAADCRYHRARELDALYVFRAADVNYCLTSSEFWSKRSNDSRLALLKGEERELQTRIKSFFALWPVFSDGAYHERIRHIAIRALRAAVTPELLDSWRKFTTGRLDALRASPFDWIGEIARPLAWHAVATLTGEASADGLIELGRVVMHELSTPRIDMVRAGAALEAVEALRLWLRCALDDPPSGFIDGLTELVRDEKFGLESATALLTQMVTGAYEPIASTLGVVGERVNQEVLTSISADVLRNEVFRFSTPFRFASRYARRPVTLGPHRLEAGERIILGLGTSNFDSSCFPEPREFRSRSELPRSFSFGVGRHYCPGAPLAHAAVGVLIESLVASGLYFVVDRVEREPELAMLRYRRLEGRLVECGGPI